MFQIEKPKMVTAARTPTITVEDPEISAARGHRGLRDRVMIVTSAPPRRFVGDEQITEATLENHEFSVRRSTLMRM